MNFRRVLLGLACLASAGTAAQAASGAVARVALVSGSVEILRDGAWEPATKEMPLLQRDQIRTGSEALARIKFLDADIQEGASATIVDLVPNSQISLEQFTIARQVPRQRTGLIDVLKGAVRSMTKGWSNGSMFSVRAGSTVCGVRGSAVAVSFDVATGTAQFTSLSGEMMTYPARNMAEAIQETVRITAALASGVDPVPGTTALVPGEQSTIPAGGTATVMVLPASLTEKLLSVLTNTDQSAESLALAASLQAEIDAAGGTDAGKQGAADAARKQAQDLGGEADRILQGIMNEVSGDNRLNQPASDF